MSMHAHIAKCDLDCKQSRDDYQQLDLNTKEKTTEGSKK